MTLPPELLSNIISFIGTEDKSSLANLSISSKWLHETTLPYLYDSIYLTDPERQNYSTASPPALRPLARTVLSNPRIASLIHSVTIRPALMGDNRWERDAAQTIPVEDCFKSKIKQLSISGEEEQTWLNSAGLSTSSDCIFALLLVSLVNLRTADLMIFTEPEYWSKKVLTRIANHHTPFEDGRVLASLRVCMIAGADEKYGASPEPVGSVLQLPSIESVFLHRFGSNDEASCKGFENRETRSSSVEHLDVKDCRFNVEDIRHLIRIPKKLRSFLYEIGWGHLSYSNINSPALEDALKEHHKDTLESLFLDYDHNRIEFLEDDVVCFGDFKAFSRLKHLRIALCYLLGNDESDEDIGRATKPIDVKGFDIFPKSLEVLEFAHCEDGMDRIIDKAHLVVDNKVSKTPKLWRITIEGPIKEETEFHRSLTALANSANIKGIDFLTVDNRREATYYVGEDVQERKWGPGRDIEFAQCFNCLNKLPIYEVVDIQR